MSAKKFKNRANKPKTRKQLRKEERKNKKIRRHEYYTNRKKPGQFVLLKKDFEEVEHAVPQKKSPKKLVKSSDKGKNDKIDRTGIEDVRKKEKKQQIKLQKQMNKQRNKQLLDANLEEDKNIKRLEKLLKLNKRKSKSVPASFARDGLDYVLDVCDPENLERSALAEQQLAEVNDEFEEDLVLMTGGPNKERKKKKDEMDILEDESDFDVEDEEEIDDVDSGSEETEEEEDEEDSEYDEKEDKIKPKSKTTTNEENNGNRKIRGIEVESDEAEEQEDEESSEDDLDEEDGEDEPKSKKRKNEADSSGSRKIRRTEVESDQTEDEEEVSSKKVNDDGTWEDIYGRLRAKDGSIINQQNDKYIPPTARLKNSEESVDKIRAQKLQRLKKQLKGLINRLAESNMHSISTQIEELYMNNSRNDMNSTITNLVLEALVSNILAPERLLMEHVLLIAILHANVGTEVGAHFLETVAQLFDNHLKNSSVEDKKLDNLVIILGQLYNFKLFDSKLIYEILDKLSENFTEKEVECILHILRNVGFSLRKDNPLALKNLILTLQKKASSASDEMKDNSRVKFMLDILLAIKNNNVSKIPNYDPSYSEHLKKIMKGFIRKGNYVTQLNISLEDLLKAEEKGKWWVVGSAWTGNSDENLSRESTFSKSESFSQKLLDLASKQRMNTDTRKNVFCIIMSAEDYLDAFEKLLKLGLKNQQEREIIHVILHCCLQEKNYNPYYSALAQKFCEYDRKFQMTIKYSIWDKLKALRDHSATQISNLAKLLSHLFIEKGLPISTLKVIQFSELDKVTLRFIRQILLGILLHEDIEVCRGVFEKVGQSEKLKMFRESLKLFVYHFLLKNLDSQGVSTEKREMLQQRVKVIEKLLSGKIRF